MGSGGADLALKAACESCGVATELYGTACRHATLCRSCGAAVARARGRCVLCAAPVTTLIREYTVRLDTDVEKAFSIGRFSTGLPPLSKKRNAGSRWSLRKEGPPGRQLAGNVRDKYYSRKPWILEDETGEYQYQGQTEGSQSATATYYLLMKHGNKEFNAVPVGSWYNFSKIAQYKQLTLEEAEEKMNRRRSSASGYERWMMKAAANGAAAFSSDVKKLDNVEETTGGDHPRKGDRNEDGDQSDKGEEDQEGGAARKNRHGLSTKGMDDDDEEGGKDRDFDLDDEIEKGADWEHEEIFTDDDEALDIDTEERPDLADHESAPSEIKQDDDESEHDGSGGSNLSKSGQELKKLLCRAAGVESDEDDKDKDEDSPPSPVLGSKQIVEPKTEPEDYKPAKTTQQHAQNTTAFKSIRKRKPGGDDISKSTASKKMKTELATKTSVVKVETPSLEPASGASLPATATNSSRITEEEIRTVLLAVAPITSQELVSKFKSRLQTQEEKREFAAMLTKISYIKKTKGGNHIVLREQYK